MFKVQKLVFYLLYFSLVCTYIIYSEEMPEKFFLLPKKKFLNKLLKVLHVDLQLVATYIFNMFVLKFETFFQKKIH